MPGSRISHSTVRKWHSLGQTSASRIQMESSSSNGRTRYVETVIATYGVADLFLPRVTADDVGDKTAILRHYLTTLPADPRRTVMVGDRASDVDAARAVGCAFIGCDYGHGHRQEIEHAGPLVQDFAALRAVIASLLA